LLQKKQLNYSVCKKKKLLPKRRLNEFVWKKKGKRLRD